MKINIIFLTLLLTAPTAAFAATPNLVRNGSFEEVRLGMDPPLPTGWLLERWSRKDEVTVVSDPAQSHRGRRCLRIAAPGIHGLRMHSLRPGGIQMKPGTTYVIRFWARCESGASARATVEPGGGEFKLGQTWKRYAVRYDQPRTARAAMGLFVAIQGGPAYLDDVSIVESGVDEPVEPELKVRWQGLTNATVEHRWLKPGYQERITLELREVVGHRATRYPVRLELGRLLRSYRFDFLARDSISVVDPSRAGGKEVPWVIVNADRNPDLSTRDQLAFLTTCPPRTRKVYHIYVKGRTVAQSKLAPLKELPGEFNVRSNYKHRLAVDVGKIQRVHSINIRTVKERLSADIRSGIATNVSAQLSSADGQQKIALPLKHLKPGRWRVAEGFRLPQKHRTGIWQMQVVFRLPGGQSRTRSTAFVVGNGMWAEGLARRIYRDSRPKYVKRVFRVFAAGNEWQSFQLGIASNRGLRGLRLRATDLRRRGGSEAIGSSSIKIESIEHTYAAYGFRSGPFPDPLLPWRSKGIAPATNQVALVTVRVPPESAAGVYRGELIATSSDGVKLKMPLEIEVFGFSLPSRRSFTPVLTAGISAVHKNAGQNPTKRRGRFRYSKQFPMPRRRTRVDSARFLAERHITPMYYSQANSPYPTPWLWDAKSKQMDVDFTRLDEALAIFKHLDIKYIFLGSHYRPRPNRGAIYSKDPRTNKYVYGWHGTRNGEVMMRAWLKPVYAHLQKKGWAGRTIVYINDELWHTQTADGQKLNTLLENYGRLIHQVAPKFRTCAADNALGDWIGAMDETDIFTGLIRKDNLQRLRKQGGEWWGLYNRSMYLHKPLGNCRLLGMDSYFRGWSHYFHVDITRWGSDPWVNPRRYARAGGKNNFFVSGSGPDGFDMMVYPWPSWSHRRWQPGLPTVCSSLRLEALRESIDDYEYLKMLAASVKRLPTTSMLKEKCQRLLKRARNFVDRCNSKSDWRYGGSHSDFLINDEELQSLRRDIGRAIAEANKSSSGAR